MRIGFGYDNHRLIEGRPLMIGGINIPSQFGEDAHSDGDVLIHAICDALLGAANLRDIGYHFPDNASKYKNIDSKILLAECIRLIKEKGYEVSNIDATICAQAPKLSPHIDKMKTVLAQTTNLEIDDISIKATTTERLGFTGREEGISAYAVVLIEQNV